MLTIESVQTIVESAIAEINTQIPGTIISYDAATNRAVVKPDLPKHLADDVALASPNIVEAPVQWSSGVGGKAGLTMPLKAGDKAILTFQQRSIEGWLSGNNNMPDDPRQFDLSDCVAIPGGQPNGFAGDPNDVVLKFDKAQVRMEPNGTVTMGNDKGHIKIDPDGNMILKAKSIRVETLSNTFNFEQHRHEKTQSHPTDISGPPLGDLL